MRTKELMHKVELFVDKIIPYLVIILLGIILIEFIFSGYVGPYAIYLTMFDYLIIFFFCIDLVFKYMKIRKIPLFLRKHWLDIIAVFPFFLVFRLFQELYAIASIPRLLTEPPTLLHQGIILEKEGLRLVKAAEQTEKISRTRFLVRFIKPIQKLPRLLKIIPYFEKPTKEHHKTIEEIVKEKLSKKVIDIASPKDYLAEWIARFVKNKDIIFKNITGISQKEELVIAKLKDGKEHVYLVEPFLDDSYLLSAIDRLKNNDYCSLVTYNTKDAFDAVIKNWEKLAKFKRHFSIYFINPFSKTEKRWTLYPMAHDFVTEEAGLKPGLLSLFSTVDATTKEEIEKVLKTEK